MNQVPPMGLAALKSTSLISRKNERSLPGIRFELEVIIQSGSGGLDDYNLSRTIIA